MEKLKSCFQVQSSNYNKPLHGTVVSVEDVVECFEVDEFSETLQIPVEFIKKLRLFEFTRNGERASVQPTHQSFLEFSCALSLCLNGGDLQHELSEIKERSIYISVVLHMAGLFSEKANSCSVLNSLKQLCGLNGDQERRRSLHAVFESITSRASRIFAKEGIEVHITLASGEKIKTNSKVTNLLVEVMRASGEKVSLTLKRVIVPNIQEDEWEELESVLDFINLLQTKPEEEMVEVISKNDDFQFKSLKYATDTNYIRLCAFFGAIQGWSLDFLDLDKEMKEVSKSHSFFVSSSQHPFQVLKMLVFLTENAKVERMRITKSTHNICVLWNLKEARWTLRKLRKVEKGAPLIQQSDPTKGTKGAPQQSLAVGTQLDFNLERGLGGRQISSEESEKERENSVENKSI